MNQTRSEIELDGRLKEKLKTKPIWFENVLLIKSKSRAIGETTVDIERAFHLMSRIQTKLTNRLDNSPGSRLKVTMHIPKDPT